MANIDINSGQTYFFSRSQNSTFIMDSTDHSHAPKVFVNQLIVSGALSLNANILQVDAEKNDQQVLFRRINTTTATATPLMLISGRNIAGDASCAITFDSPGRS